MFSRILLLPVFVLASWAAFAQDNYVAGTERDGAVNSAPVTTSVPCDTTFSFRSKDDFPGGITTDGTYIWCHNYHSPYIYGYTFSGVLADSILHPATATIPLSGNEWGGDIDFDGTNLLVFHEESNKLYKVNPQTHAVVAQFTIAPCSTNCYGVTFDGTYIWVSDYYPVSRLYKINPNSGNVISTINPVIAFSAIKFVNGTLYGLPPFQNELLTIDPVSGAILSTEPWCLNYASGFFNYNNQFWGISSMIAHGGTERIYRFGQFNATEENTAANLLSVFPNPATGSFTVSFPTAVSGRVEVTNVLGQRVHSQAIANLQEQTLHLPAAPAGLYTVRFSSGEKTWSQKIVIE